MEPSPQALLLRKPLMRPETTDFSLAICINCLFSALCLLAAVIFAVMMTLHHLYKIVDAVIGMRVEEKNEIIGLDLTQQSEAAYTVIE